MASATARDRCAVLPPAGRPAGNRGCSRESCSCAAGAQPGCWRAIPRTALPGLRRTASRASTPAILAITGSWSAQSPRADSLRLEAEHFFGDTVQEGRLEAHHREAQARIPRAVHRLPAGLDRDAIRAPAHALTSVPSRLAAEREPGARLTNTRCSVLPAGRQSLSGAASRRSKFSGRQPRVRLERRTFFRLDGGELDRLRRRVRRMPQRLVAVVVQV